MNTQVTTPEYNSLKYVMGKFREILTKEIEVNVTEGQLYYKGQDELRKMLVEFLRLRFVYLNTGELLKLCSLVSTHRPVAPHSFLITCAALINE